MFFTAVIYIVGLCAYFADISVPISFLMMILGIFAILKNYLSPKIVLFWYFIFFFAFFNANIRIKNTDQLYQIAPQNVEIQGQIISIPINSGFKTKFFFNVSKINYNGKNENVKAKTLVTLFSDNKNIIKLNIGDNYKLKGKLRIPFEVSNPSQFDYEKYLKNFGVFTLFYGDYIDCKPQAETLTYKWKLLQGLNNTRNDIIQSHAKYLKSPNLELLGGVVFGDDAISPPDELKVSFQHSGLLHLLAASGMNVALIYGIWFFILRKFRAPFNLTVLSGIFVVIFYSLMTGLGASVIRAALMLIFILVGKLIDRDAHSISLLSFVGLLMLIYNPAYINDVGFQLSFLVTFGLLVMAPVVFEKIAATQEEKESIKDSRFNLNKLPNWLSGAIFVPIIAQIWVAPIQMYYFNSFSLYSVFANIISLPLVTVISFGGFISAVLALIKPLASQICFLFDLVLNPVLSVLVAVSDYFSNLPHSLIQMPQPNIFQLFLYYGIVLLAVLILKTGKNKKLIFATSFLSIILIISCLHFPDNNLETLTFNVQNADAFLIKTPKNKYFIIDSGKMGYKGGKTQAQMIILEYLKDRGIKNIEGFIITHFDSDHAGGAVDLINNLNIKNVYVNSLNDKSNLAKKIYSCVNCRKNIHILLAKNNENIYTEEPQHHFFYVMLNLFQHRKDVRQCDPETSSGRRDKRLNIKIFVAGFKGKEVENENSIVVLISNKHFNELFMGDAGIEAFNQIKKYLPKQVQILKIGHHGAKNVINKSFLDRINPKVAIISTGINNYGHPNGVTLDILEQHKVKTLRTDRQNAIKIDENLDGTYNIYSYDKSGWIKS